MVSLLQAQKHAETYSDLLENMNLLCTDNKSGGT